MNIGDSFGSSSASGITHNVSRAAFILAAFAFLQKSLSLLQQLLITRTMGLNSNTDAFYIAQTAPLLVGSMISVMLTTTLVPAFRRTGRDDAELTGVILSSLGLLIVLAALLGFCNRTIIGLFGPGLSAPAAQLAQRLLREMSPIIFLMGVTGILTACHYHASSFLVPAIASCLLYVGGVAGVLLRPWLRIDGLAWGLVSGSVLQVAVLLKGIDRRAFAAPLFGREPMLRFSSKAAAILTVTAVSPMYAILDRAFASGLAPGTVGAVTMALNLIAMPSSLIVMSLNSALLPGLVLLRERRSAFAEVVRWAIIYMVFLLLPAALIMWWWSGPIMRLLLQSRQVDANAAVVAGGLLAAYSFSMVGIGLKDVLSNALIALGRERVALTAGLVSLAASVALKWFHLAHVGTVWIASSTSVSAWIATAMLIVVFSRMVPIAWLTIWTKEGWRILADCVILCAVCYTLSGWVTTGPVWATAAGICGTGLVYFSAAYALRLRITDLRDPRPYEEARY